MKKILLIALTTCFFSSCLDENEVSLPESEYQGVFIRLTPDASPVESGINLTLANGRFTGISDSLYYPAVCSGTYSIEGKEITFRNECAWTANFDWTYILNGTYMIEVADTETVFIQEISEDVFNIYKFENSGSQQFSIALDGGD